MQISHILYTVSWYCGTSFERLLQEISFSQRNGDLNRFNYVGDVWGVEQLCMA